MSPLPPPQYSRGSFKAVSLQAHDESFNTTYSIAINSALLCLPISTEIRLIGWLLVYVLATPKVISGWVPTCSSAHSWWLYSAAPLRDQAAVTITWYLSHNGFDCFDWIYIQTRRFAQIQFYVLVTYLSYQDGCKRKLGEYITWHQHSYVDIENNFEFLSFSFLM